MTHSNSNNPFEQVADTLRPATKPRICIASGRNFKKKAWLCGHYEAQDVLAQVDDVDLICLRPGFGHQFRFRWQNRLMHHDLSRKIVFANPGLQSVKLTREYDLFVVRCQTYQDLLDINAVKGWKDRCKTSICWIDEMWSSQIPDQKYWLHALRQFDHVFVGFSGTVAPLSKAIGRPCRHLPAGVDVLRFTPYPNPPARVVDVYSIGRRAEGSHRALVEASQRSDLFYIYDTFAGSQVDVNDHRQHRDHFASLAKRSRFFMVSPAKMDCLHETQGQVEIGHRYYEGAAAGTVLIGRAPNCEAFGEMFPWRDAVIEIQPDGSDVMDVLEGFRSEPERACEIGRRNAVESLLRHDWAYRWKEVLRVAGVNPSPRMAARECRLKELADLGAMAPNHKVSDVQKSEASAQVSMIAE